MIPKDWDPTAMKPAPGTGPFVFKSFIPNEMTEFTRFDQYWEIDEKTGDRLPYLDSFYVKKIVDPIVRWTALRTGDLDYVQYPPTMPTSMIKNPLPGLSQCPIPVGTYMIYFNVTQASIR